MSCSPWWSDWTRSGVCSGISTADDFRCEGRIVRKELCIEAFIGAFFGSMYVTVKVRDAGLTTASPWPVTLAASLAKNTQGLSRVFGDRTALRC